MQGIIIQFIMGLLIDLVKKILSGVAVVLPTGPIKEKGVKLIFGLVSAWFEKNLVSGKGPLDESDLRAVTKIISQRKGELVLLFANKGFDGLMEALKIEAIDTENTLDDLKVEAVTKAIDVGMISLSDWMQGHLDTTLAGLLTGRQCELIIIGLRNGTEGLFDGLRKDAEETAGGMDDMVVATVENAVKLILVQLQNWVETELETVEIG